MKEKSEHNCGSWPDPNWTEEDYKLKAEAKKKCPACNPIDEI
jgi:hypothetical protein